MPSAVQSKKHICGICHEGFGSKAAQKAHRRGKHPQPPAQPKPSPPSNAPSTAQTKKHICDVCQQGFDSRIAQKDHRRAKHFPSSQLDLTPSIVHQSTLQTKKHTCGTCQEVFDTKSAKKKHRLAKHSRPIARQAIIQTIAPSSLGPVHILFYRGTVYSTISVAEQDIIRSNLAVLCHSEQRLKMEGHKFPNTLVDNEDSMAFTANMAMSCPEKNPSTPKRAAIVLDCEMAGAFGGQNELIQVTMLDFLSGNILTSCLVNPSTPIKDWREDITGINDLTMAEAVMNNEALHGWEAARAELWRFADKETIIIGHSVHHDLKALHTSHARIIDTAIVTAEAALGKTSKIGKRWGLAPLCQELLGIQIRASLQLGQKEAHDSLEDTLATRELCLLCVQRPDQLKRWGRTAKAAFFKGKGKKSASSRAGINRRSDYFMVEESDYDSDDYEEPLRWEDVIEWEMWPKSPPSD